MIQVEPQKFYPLTWNVPDPTDTTTYYVRAYVYTIEDGVRTLLDTLDMSDQSDLTFFYNYQMPSDVSGQGRPVIIVYKAYTDASYATEQEYYANRFTETYLVKETWNRTYMGGKGVDYKKINRMIGKQIKKIPKVKFKETDLSPIIQAIMDKPITPETELGGLIRIVEKTNMAIADRPQFEKTDLSGLTSGLSKANKRIKKAHLDKVVKTTETMLERIRHFFTNDLDEIKKSVSELQKDFSKRVFVATPLKTELIKKEKEKVDKKEYRKHL